MMWGLLGVMLSTSDILVISVKLHAKLWWLQTKRLQLRIEPIEPTNTC